MSGLVFFGGGRRFLWWNHDDASQPDKITKSPGKSFLFFVKDRVRGIDSSVDTEKV